MRYMVEQGQIWGSRQKTGASLGCGQNGVMTALEVLERHRPAIEKLCRQYGVRRLRLFGSGSRADWDPSTSDFDFLVEFGPPPPGIDPFLQQFGLLVRLEALLNRPVDLVDWNAAKKPLFRQVAESQAMEWYAA